MGSQSFTTYSRGKDAKDAYNRAVEDAEDEYGHQEGYSGAINSSAGFRDITSEFKNSKKSMNQFIDEQMEKLTKFEGARAICIEEPKGNTNKIKTQVEHIVTPGTKKWVLMYVVYCHESRITSAPTKTEAVKLARQYSEKNQCTTTIKMERTLQKREHALVAKISYKKSTNEKEGKYVFFGWASC
jgi:hypothetical protein